jgi:hypothetical protein
MQVHGWPRTFRLDRIDIRVSPWQGQPVRLSDLDGLRALTLETGSLVRYDDGTAKSIQQTLTMAELGQKSQCI